MKAVGKKCSKKFKIKSLTPSNPQPKKESSDEESSNKKSSDKKNLQIKSLEMKKNPQIKRIFRCRNRKVESRY